MDVLTALDGYAAANRPGGQHRFGFGMSGRLLCDQRFVALLPWQRRSPLAVRCRNDCRLIYGAVMISLLGVALGWHPDGERETQLGIAWALSQPFGRGVVGFVGLVILGCGIGVIAWVMTTDVDDDVDLPESEKRVIEPIAPYGLAGRGVGAALVGIYWMSAGIHGERQGHTNSAVLCKLSSRTHAAGCYCCR